MTPVGSTRVWVERHAAVPRGPSSPSIVHSELTIALTILCVDLTVLGIAFAILGVSFLVVEKGVGAVVLKRSNKVPEGSGLIDIPD